MRLRRITTAVCVLALAAPAAAGAKDAPQPPKFARAGAAEVTKHYEQAISGDTHGRLPRAIAPASSPGAATSSDSVDGWQLAALTEAALLAAVAFGSVAIVRARRSAPRMGM
jgi:hypothetical protein